MTGIVAIDLFLTLDGVGQAPGGPEEDPSGGFPFGGWQAPFADAVAGTAIVERVQAVDALLLGRRTYDLFAGYWPEHTGNPVGDRFAEIPKYVASRSAIETPWEGSTQLGADLAAEVRALKERHERTHVIGSIDLVQTLLAERLWDELAVWIYPVVLGTGKKAFPDGVLPTALRPLAPPLVGDSGAVLLRLGPDGEPRTGEMDPE